MTVTYVLPLADDTHKVRIEIGDTDTANAMLQDEEIDYYLTTEGDAVLRAAARSAGAIAATFARLVSTSIGDVRVEAQQQYEHYTALAASLADRAVTAGGAAVPYLGGISIDDVRSRDEDTDRVAAFFTRRTGDNPPLIDRSDLEDWR